MSGSATGDRSLWLRLFHPSPAARVRLLCFPHAGGAASFFFPMSAMLSGNTEVHAVQYPGRQDRRTELCLTSVQELAAAVHAQLAGWDVESLALFGHSLGASVAFEVARLLEQRASRAPVALFVSGRQAPSRHISHGVHLLDDEGVFAELQRLNGTDVRLFRDPELIASVLPAIRSDYRAAETYRYEPGPPLSCPIVALNGNEDDWASREDIAAWHDHTSAGYTSHVFPGGHFYLNEQRDAVVGTLIGVLADLVGAPDRPVVSPSR